MAPRPTSVQPPPVYFRHQNFLLHLLHLLSQLPHQSPIHPQLSHHITHLALLKDSPKFAPFVCNPERFRNTPGLGMADSEVVSEENPTQYHDTKQGWEDHVHQLNLKKGFERLDRRSANPNKGAVKKHGHGGKFTVDGPYTEEDYADPVPAAMDENDPNYVDPTDEQADEDAGIPTVEVAKVAEAGISKVEVVTVAETGAGTAHPAS